MSDSKKHKRKTPIIVIIVGMLLIFASMILGYLMGSPTVAIVGMAIGAVMVGATGLADELGWLMGAKNNIDMGTTNETSKRKKGLENKLFGELEEGDIFYED